MRLVRISVMSINNPVESIINYSQQLELINKLQQLEAGVTQNISSSLLTTIENQHKLVKKSYKLMHPPSKTCLICNIDITIGHHVQIFNSQRNYNGDTTTENYRDCIAYIWICPNCHHRIHNCNPYFKLSRNK